MSFWTYLKPAGTGPADEATIGSMLRDLHGVLRTYPAALPDLPPLTDIPVYLARPQTRLSAGDAAAVAEAFRRLTERARCHRRSRPAAARRCGRAQPMATDSGWVWHDFEDTGSGPVAWDLAATTASPRLERARILAAYGEQSIPGNCAFEQLRRLTLTVWYTLYAERLPECEPRAAELLAEWRTPCRPGRAAALEQAGAWLTR